MSEDILSIYNNHIQTLYFNSNNQYNEEKRLISEYIKSFNISNNSNSKNIDVELDQNQTQTQSRNFDESSKLQKLITPANNSYSNLKISKDLLNKNENNNTTLKNTNDVFMKRDKLPRTPKKL
jgi:hypothetical protein